MSHTRRVVCHSQVSAFEPCVTLFSAMVTQKATCPNWCSFQMVSLGLRVPLWTRVLGQPTVETDWESKIMLCWETLLVPQGFVTAA